MITPITNSDDIIILLRKEIMNQLSLDGKYVVNALSVYGPDMNVGQTNTVFNSVKPTDTFIIFELEEENGNDNMQEDMGDHILTYVEYSFNLYIYGNKAGINSHILKSRLMSPELIEGLEEKGIHIRTIEEPASINEFINNVMWQRRDMSIHISVRYDVNKINNYQSFEKLNETEIDKYE